MSVHSRFRSYISYWRKGINYEQFADLDLLQSVKETKRRYERWHV